MILVLFYDDAPCGGQPQTHIARRGEAEAEEYMHTHVRLSAFRVLDFLFAWKWLEVGGFQGSFWT